MKRFSKKRLISIIKYLGITFDEVVIDIIVEGMNFNSIEWRRDTNQIILHKFIEELDYEIDFDELPSKIKKQIYLFLLLLLN
jgi:hypothetical protein